MPRLSCSSNPTSRTRRTMRLPTLSRLRLDPLERLQCRLPAAHGRPRGRDRTFELGARHVGRGADESCERVLRGTLASYQLERLREQLETHEVFGRGVDVGRQELPDRRLPYELDEIVDEDSAP